MIIRGLHGSDSDHVYFEKQSGRDRLCGLHCLNNLLQGPVFTSAMLASIGQKLNADERRLAGGEPTSARNDGGAFPQSEWSNVSADGNFSLTTLELTLAQRGFSLVNLNRPDLASLRAEPAKLDDGFVCNFHEHWIAVRPVRGRYFRLDSLRPAPEHIASSDLRSYIQALQGEQYSVFLVRHAGGERLPPPPPEPVELPVLAAKDVRGPLSPGQYLLSFAAVTALNNQEGGGGYAGGGGYKGNGNANVSGRGGATHQWPTDDRGHSLVADAPSGVSDGGATATETRDTKTFVNDAGAVTRSAMGGNPSSDIRGDNARSGTEEDAELKAALAASVDDFLVSLPAPLCCADEAEERDSSIRVRVKTASTATHVFPANRATFVHLFDWVHKHENLAKALAPDRLTANEPLITLRNAVPSTAQSFTRQLLPDSGSSSAVAASACSAIRGARGGPNFEVYDEGGNNVTTALLRDLIASNETFRLTTA